MERVNKDAAAVHIYFSDESDKCLFAQDTRKNSMLAAAKELAARLNDSTQWGMKEIESVLKTKPISDDLKHSRRSCVMAIVDGERLYGTCLNGLLLEILSYLFNQLLFHEDMRFSEIMTHINSSGETHDD